jgi:hypothetical protein
MITDDFPPQLVLQQLIEGFKITQCIYVAAKLGIADRLSEGPICAYPAWNLSTDRCSWLLAQYDALLW